MSDLVRNLMTSFLASRLKRQITQAGRVKQESNINMTQDIMYNKVVKFLFLNPKFQAVTVQAGLCGTWLETPKTSFLTMRLM